MLLKFADLYYHLWELTAVIAKAATVLCFKKEKEIGMFARIAKEPSD